MATIAFSTKASMTDRLRMTLSKINKEGKCGESGGTDLQVALERSSCKEIAALKKKTKRAY